MAVMLFGEAVGVAATAEEPGIRASSWKTGNKVAFLRFCSYGGEFPNLFPRYLWQTKQH